MTAARKGIYLSIVFATALFGVAHAATVEFLNDGTGRYPDANPVIEWNDKTNVLWKTPVDSSYSSPIIVGKSVVVTSEQDKVFCVDLDSGKVQWKVENPVSGLPKEQQERAIDPPHESGAAAATPASDGEKVYCVYATGIVAAFDLKTGNRVWTQVISSPATSSDGRSASPIIAGTSLIVSLGELYALDTKTGNIRWKQEEAQEGFGTPIATKVGADDVIVTPKGAVVNLADGKLLNSLDASLSFSSPCFVDKKVGFIDASFSIFELPAKLDPKTKVEPYWSDFLEGSEVYSTALYHEGLLYTIVKDGTLQILDVKNKKKTQKKLELVDDPGTALYASPVLAGKYIFLSNNRGRTVVMEPGTDPKVIKTNELGDGSGATPTFVGTKMLIRSGEFLYCIGTK
jgi:outer membrane protein assembly factor BamB